MAIYYVDLVEGARTSDGKTPQRPALMERDLPVVAGDTVLFRRGGKARRMLEAVCGTPSAQVSYGAYGEGEKPVFCGSQDISLPEHWIEEQPAIWRYIGQLTDEPCNLIFGDGEICGNLRPDIQALNAQGQWCATMLGYGNNPPQQGMEDELERKLWVYSAQNPAEHYGRIECALYGARRLVAAAHDITLEDIAFEGAGVHGYHAVNARRVTIRRCGFRWIGGAVWRRGLSIRFGNAIELWDSAEDVLIEGCLFDQIYDSAITHQGGAMCVPVRNVVIRQNTICRFGMAAYEVRDRLPIASRFEQNHCRMAGGGFSLQGLPAPRDSEIYPEPMGHHIFLWRIDGPTQGGGLTIEGNTFDGAPDGSVIYSRIDAQAEAQITLRANCTMGQIQAPCYSRDGGLDEKMITL